jgi:hypothetical protein
MLRPLRLEAAHGPSAAQEHQLGRGDRIVNVYWVAAVWIGMALLAGLVSIRVGISARSHL